MFEINKQSIPMMIEAKAKIKHLPGNPKIVSAAIEKTMEKANKTINTDKILTALKNNPINKTC